MTHTKREVFHCFRGVDEYSKGDKGVIKAKVYYRKGTIKHRKHTAYFQLREVLGYRVKADAANLFMTYDNGYWFAYDCDCGMPVASKKTTKDDFYNYLIDKFSHEDAFLSGCIDYPKMRKTLGKKLYPVNKEG